MKKSLNRVVSFICIGCIAFMTVFGHVAFAAAGVIEVIKSAAEFALTCNEVYTTFIEPLVNAAPGAYTQARYICCWMDIIKDYNLSEDDFRAYYTDIATNGESYPLGSNEYNTYLFITETAANGVSLDAICLLAFHDTGTSDYTINDDGDENSKFQVTGKALKDMTADYNSRYMPMANEDQYFYHYQGDNMTHLDSPRWYFTPFCPVYLFEKQWGNKGWTDYYFIPVVSDDDKTTFYGQQYGHIYAKNVDGTTTMYFDLINMSDDSIAKSFSFVYDATTYKWIGLEFNGSLYNIYGFNSSYNYLNGKLVGGQYAEYGPFVQGINMLSWDGSSTIGLNFLLTDSTFSPKTNKNDDWGYILSNNPFELFANQTSIDFDKIPDNYVITINGDTIYDYSVTNPDTGDSTTINNYITNNYVIPEGEKKDDCSSSGGSVSGSVIVGGKVDVSGDITIKSDPININVNVNSGSSSGGSVGTGEAVRFDQDIGLNNYYNWMQEQTTGFSGFMKNFFGWLPADIVIMLCAGFGLVILARFLGR